MDVNTFEKSEKETMRVWSNYNKWNELTYECIKFWMHNMFLVCSMPLLQKKTKWIYQLAYYRE